MKVKTKCYIHDHILDEQDYQHLKVDSIYSVIGIDDEFFRVIDENGDPALYPKELFTVIDPTIPDTWCKRYSKYGGYYIDPPEFSGNEFYDDFFEGVENSIMSFKKFIKNNVKYFDGDENITVIFNKYINDFIV